MQYLMYFLRSTFTQHILVSYILKFNTEKLWRTWWLVMYLNLLKLTPIHNYLFCKLL